MLDLPLVVKNAKRFPCVRIPDHYYRGILQTKMKNKASGDLRDGLSMLAAFTSVSLSLSSLPGQHMHQSSL